MDRDFPHIPYTNRSREAAQVEVGGLEGVENQLIAILLLLQEKLWVKRKIRVGLAIAQLPPLLAPEPQKPFIIRRFRHLQSACHHDPVLNSSCSTPNPTRQVAASNGMVLSTMETTWLSCLLALPSPSLPSGG